MSFRVVIEQIDLYDALKKVRSTVNDSKKDTGISGTNDKYISIKSQIKEATGNPVLKLTTSNLQETSEVIIPVISGDPGDCPLVEYSKFTSIISTIDSTVEIELEGKDDNKLYINYVGRSEPIVFNGASPESYVTPTVGDTVLDTILPMGILKEGLDKISSVIFDDDRYPIFNSSNIKIENNNIEFSAIDSRNKRIIIYNKATTNTNDLEFFVECNDVKKMLSNLDIGRDVQLKITKNNAVFEQDGLEFTTRLLDGTFPDCHKFIPLQFSTEMSFNKSEMLSSLDRVKIMTDSSKNTVRKATFKIDNSFTTIDQNSVYGALSEVVSCNLTGQPFDISFMVDTFIDTLKTFDSEDMKVCFYNNSGGVLMPVAPIDYNHKCFIPAVRMSND